MQMTRKLLPVVKPGLEWTTKCHNPESCTSCWIKAPVLGMNNVQRNVEVRRKLAQVDDSRHNEPRAAERIEIEGIVGEGLGPTICQVELLDRDVNRWKHTRVARMCQAPFRLNRPPFDLPLASHLGNSRAQGRERLAWNCTRFCWMS